MFQGSNCESCKAASRVLVDARVAVGDPSTWQLMTLCFPCAVTKSKDTSEKYVKAKSVSEKERGRVAVGEK